MKLTIELTEKEIRTALANHISNVFGIQFSVEEVPIEVKSKQNYKSEWESAAIRINFTIEK